MSLRFAYRLPRLRQKGIRGKEGDALPFTRIPSISLFLFKSYFNLTFRATSSFYEDLYPDQPHPSFQSLHWFVEKKLPPQRMESLFKKLRESLDPFLPEENNSLFILDTTGIPHRGKTQRLKWMQGTYSREVRGLKACFVVLFWKERLLLLEGIRVDSGYAPDAKLGSEVVGGTSLKGFLLADLGFDSLEMFEKAEREGFIPTIKLKGGGKIRDKRRKKAKRLLTPFYIACGLSPRAYLAV